MAKSNTSGLARSLRKLQEPPVTERDPEALPGHKDGSGDSDSGGSESEEGEGEKEVRGTEHYVGVGRSRLRTRAPTSSLGPRYRGIRVTRAALGLEAEDDDDDNDSEDDEDDDDDEDTDPNDLDEEYHTAEEQSEHRSEDTEQSEHDAAPSDEDKPDRAGPPISPRSRQSRKRPGAADWLESPDHDIGFADESYHSAGAEQGAMEGVDEDEDSVMEGGSRSSAGEDDADNVGSDEEAEEVSEGYESDESGAEKAAPRDADDGSAHARKLATTTTTAELVRAGGAGRQDSDRQAALSTLSQAARKDAQKGMAIRQQRRFFDGLLNVRIRLQKALIAANSLHLADGVGADIDLSDSELQPAEEAALSLWNALDDLRSDDEADCGTGGKRKRAAAAADRNTDTQQLWEEMQAYREGTTQRDDDILDKWSARLRATENRPTPAKPLSSVLRDQLADPAQRLVKRCRVVGSCAPTQLGQKITEDPMIYDDTDFYQSLLKELVEQRTTDSMSAAAIGLGDAARLVVAPARQDRTRKVVDRKASKGRKMRFTTHEKLQNFMASEDRRSWERSAIDRFFGTLFGQRMELDEGEAEAEAEGGDEGEAGLGMAEAGGFRLFGG